MYKIRLINIVNLSDEDQKKAAFEESIETPVNSNSEENLEEDAKSYNIPLLSEKMRQEAENIINIIKKHKQKENLGGLLRETTAMETHLTHYLEEEYEDLQKKSSYILFHNDDSFGEHEEKDETVDRDMKDGK